MKKALATILILSTIQTFPTPAYALHTSSAVSSSLRNSTVAIVASSVNNTGGQDLSDIQQPNFDVLLKQKEQDEKFWFEYNNPKFKIYKLSDLEDIKSKNLVKVFHLDKIYLAKIEMMYSKLAYEGIIKDKTLIYQKIKEDALDLWIARASINLTINQLKKQEFFHWNFFKYELRNTTKQEDIASILNNRLRYDNVERVFNKEGYTRYLLSVITDKNLEGVVVSKADNNSNSKVKYKIEKIPYKVTKLFP